MTFIYNREFSGTNASRLEAIALRLEAIAIGLEAIAIGLGVIAVRLEDTRL